MLNYLIKFALLEKAFNFCLNEKEKEKNYHPKFTRKAPLHMEKKT